MEISHIMVLGATSRIGHILRLCWPGIGETGGGIGYVLWHARRQMPDQTLNWVIFDPLDDRPALERAARGCSAIICLSGVVPGRGVSDAALEQNVALAEAAVRAGAASGPGGARVLLASSAAVYGDQPGMLDETTPLCPVSAYGRAKARMERRAARLGAETGVEVCSLRIGNIAGMDSILGAWTPGFGLDRFADGRTPRRSYIGMCTLARVLGDVVRAPRLPPALNIAAPGTIAMGALLDAADLAWRPRPAPPGAIAGVRLDTTALERITPFAAAEGSAGELVAQWRALAPRMTMRRAPS